jgi:hypothetical protein
MKDLYLRDLEQARERRAKLLYERNQIEAKLAWENAEIARLERLTGTEGEGVSLADVIQEVVKRGGLSAGLTDSCRRILRASERSLRSHEVVLVLEQSGFTTSRYVDPLSAVTTVLRRLAERGQARVAGTEQGWPLYVWAGAGKAEKKPAEVRERAARGSRRAS